MRAYIREQRHLCGEHYQEVDIYGVTPEQHRASRRAKKMAASRPAQQNLNEKNSRRRLNQLIAANLDALQYHLSLTYSEKYLPASPEAAEHDLTIWMDRVRRQCKKRGLPPPKYIAVTEYNQDAGGKLTVRYHHHVLIGCGLGRDELEALWHAPQTKELLGYANADRIQADHGCCEQLAAYLTKYTNRKKRWRQSKGLKKPVRPRPNDTRYTKRKVERIVYDHLGDKAFWEKQYTGWWLHAVTAQHDDYNGWHITVQLWRERKKRTEPV